MFLIEKVISLAKIYQKSCHGCIKSKHILCHNEGMLNSQESGGQHPVGGEHEHGNLSHSLVMGSSCGLVVYGVLVTIALSILNTYAPPEYGWNEMVLEGKAKHILTSFLWAHLQINKQRRMLPVIVEMVP